MSSQTKNKELLFLKRTPTVTYAGGPIPDNIRKYYEQQHLPIRKQSLAANVVNPKKRLVIPRTPMPHSNVFKSSLKGNSGFALSVDSLVEEDEDDFNFNDRPPSSIIAIKPKDLTDSEDEEEKVLILSAAPDNNWRNGSIGGKHKYFFFSLSFLYIKTVHVFPFFFIFSFYLL
ncbi:hypothetical protein EDC94DRAFT_597405 [Helicostylum pulchrum]|nr:hypothetical protein EDC94DRAFT_597405 [Helicostylum pulchrum]